MIKLFISFVLLLLTVLPGWGDTFAQSSFCWQANTPPPGSPFTNCQAVFGGETIDKVTANPDSTVENPLPDQVFHGSSIAIATPTMWKLAIDASVTDYRSDMFVAEPGELIPIVAAAHVGMSDNMTVNWLGGPGVYSLSYIFTSDGAMSTNLGQASICITVSIAPAQHGECISIDQSSNPEIPGSYMMTFSGLQFGSIINPTVFMDADWNYPFMDPADVATLGGVTQSGYASVEFGSTFHLSDMLVLDADGNPISGVTINSASGYDYPLDPQNQTNTPEPSSAGLLVMGALALWGYRTRKAFNPF